MKKSKRETVFAPIFRVVDVAFGVLTLGLAAAYVCRKYLEYAVTGKWGRTINIFYPRTGGLGYHKRNFDDEKSYRTQRHTADPEKDTT